jgi:hypothetical protein
VTDTASTARTPLSLMVTNEKNAHRYFYKIFLKKETNICSQLTPHLHGKYHSMKKRVLNNKNNV